ncbi:adhesion G-protein coupled receptor G2-like [Patiria miniata]|uniref:Uncharacterized protein n=1 Tax=Patiria miniata TaxID=46514 RepID=A0A913ZG33_PATMI|nr:adhesion G-protein coupled receptor G2-like [Patiria miniata]
MCMGGVLSRTWTTGLTVRSHLDGASVVGSRVMWKPGVTVEQLDGGDAGLWHAAQAFLTLSTTSSSVFLIFAPKYRKPSTNSIGFPPTLTIPSGTRNSLGWIGLNDKKQEGTFVWVDGTEKNYTNWSGSEPNDANNNEDCTQMWRGGRWNDLICTRALNYCCKRAGQALAVRNCSTSMPPEWKDYKARSCGDLITLDNLAKVQVGVGNVIEVAEFLANQTTNIPSDTESFEAISTILMNVVGVGSGELEVTELVVETVHNVIKADPTSLNAVNSSSIVQSIENQVSLTLRQESSVSICQDTIHVEAVSWDTTEANGGLVFASIQSRDQQESSQETTLAGTHVRVFPNTSEIPDDVDVVASIQLPENIVQLLESTNNSATQVQASFLIYGDDTLFRSALLREYNEKNLSERRVAAPVLSLTVENVELVNLTDLVVIEFKVKQLDSQQYLGGGSEQLPVCSWDFESGDSGGDWSNAGCQLEELTNETATCECNHATNFAIIMDVRGQRPDEGSPEARLALDIISQVGCALSIAALVITLIIHLFIKKLRQGKTRQILLQFCCSLLALYIVFLAGVDNAKGNVCVFVAALLHYLPLSTMMWMAVEARNIYVGTVKVFPEDSPRYMLKACLVAWGFPAIVLAVTLATALNQYKNDHYCFLEPGLVLYLGLLAPIALILIHNIITFILVMRSILKVQEASRSQQISKRLQNAVAISTLLGLTWCFGFLAISDATFVFQLIFCIANSLQGVVVFVMFCLRRDEARAALAPCMKRVCCCSCRELTQRAAKSTEADAISSSAPTSPTDQQIIDNPIYISGDVAYETRITD